MKHFSTLKKYFFLYKKPILIGILFVILSNIFKVISAPLIRNTIREINEYLSVNQHTDINNFYPILLKFLGLYGLFAMLSALFTFLMRQTIIVVSRKIEYDLKNELFHQYQKLDLSFYKRNNTGDLMSRITEDVGRVREFVGPTVMYTANLLAMFAICIPIMFMIHWKLAIISLLPLPILSVSIYLINNTINKNSLVLQQKLAKLNSIAQEVYSGIRIVKSFVKEKTFQENFEQEAETYKNQAIKIGKINAFYQPFFVGVVNLSILIIVFFGGKYVLSNEIKIENLVEFVFYINFLTWPVSALGWVATMTQRAAASMERINEFLSIQPAIMPGRGIQHKIKGEIEFAHVSLTYADTGIKAIEDISFKIPSGEKWAIIGKTGSGKSTIAEMLTAIYTPTAGSIYIDGIDYLQIEAGNYRSQIGYVPQDVFLFSDTIFNNIAFGIQHPTLEQVKAAAAMANIDEEIEKFPNGYQTIIGERGVTLSGGQKQRISIARAILLNPTIMVLDDCLSAVDVTTENKIVAALNQLFQNRSSITITHRIFNQLNFNNILVLDEGKIVEEGTHESLMACNGLYAALYYKQIKETVQ